LRSADALASFTSSATASRPARRRRERMKIGRARFAFIGTPSVEIGNPLMPRG